MGQIISVIRRCLPLCFPLPESEVQNEASHVVGVEDQNEDVQSNSTTSSMADLTFSSSSDPTVPSSSGSRWDYDVFLSFRGEDTRKNFTDHLYFALDQVGIHTFRDDEELPRGENISTELVNAIRGSRIFIVVFSKGYASSRWCLDELVEIMKCMETLGHTLLPIFYHVDPSDVRKQTGTFREAFTKHEEQFQNDMGRVRGWRVALTEAANCSGLDLESVANGYESKFIKVIVEDVLHKVNPPRLHVSEHPVGMESCVGEIKHLLNLGTNDVRIVGIYGMGGIGKTTLAKAVYNEICDTFTGSSFLSNVKEISKESIGLVRLQKQLLDDILHKKNWNVYNADRGINMIKERIQGKKVLVVVDDVYDLAQLHTLVGNFKLFGWGRGSRLIITTRDEQLLTQLEVDGKYKVGGLSFDDSFELFKWHAFKMTHPIKEHWELSVSVVKYTGGLPLALVVLGSSLFLKSVDEWKRNLKKLQKIPNREIQKVLKISFDSLDDETTKDIFLDIACFFIGVEKEYVIKILDACDLFAEDGLSILIQRSLVTIDHNKLRMHDLIRDMGRRIVFAESPNNPGKRSRLWFHENVLNVLSKHTGSETVEGLILNLPVLEDVHTEGFTNMKNLRLLQINNVHLKGSYEHLSKELKWLCWHKCPQKSLPRDFYLKDLVILDMQHSKVKQVWKTKKIFNKLKVLNLSNSINLTTLPDFSQVPQLEILILEGCTSLIEIHESIGLLKRLVLLNLRGCENLKNLSPNISKIKSFKTLVLSECIKFQKVPKELGNMTALTKLNLEKTAIEELPSSFSLLENLKILSLGGCEGLIKSTEFSQTSRLKYLKLKGCTNLVEIHESIGFPKGLDSLYLDGCQELKNLPSNMSNLKMAELSLRGCSKLQKLSEEFGHKTALCKLQYLRLDECTTLQSISLPVSVVRLNANGCTSLETILILNDMDTFVYFELNNCYEPVEIQSLKSFEFGLNARMGGCISLADDFWNSIFQVLSLFQ